MNTQNKKQLVNEKLERDIDVLLWVRLYSELYTYRQTKRYWDIRNKLPLNIVNREHNRLKKKHNKLLDELRIRLNLSQLLITDFKDIPKSKYKIRDLRDIHKEIKNLEKPKDYSKNQCGGF